MYLNILYARTETSLIDPIIIDVTEIIMTSDYDIFRKLSNVWQVINKPNFSEKKSVNQLVAAVSSVPRFAIYFIN